MPNQRPILHHLWFSDLQSVPLNHSFQLSGPEAHHAARVKRVRINQQVGLLDGQGHTAVGLIQAITGHKSKPTLTIELISHQSFPPISPRIEIYAALPKADRLDRMIDQLAQLGVSTFRPLLCDRSQRKPDSIRQDKLERIAIEAAKQCHRPWNLQITEPISFADAIKDQDAILADATGHSYPTGNNDQRTAILIGPEGGWSNEERTQITATNIPIIRFGLFVLRIEAAACAASAIVLAATTDHQGDPS